MGRIPSVAMVVFPCAVALAAACFLPRAADAALMAADLPELAGVDTFLTEDTESGLVWLDVNLTTGESFAAISGGIAIANGGALNGLNPTTGVFAANPFRYATAAELLTLFQHAAIPTPDGTFTAPNYAPVNALKALLGPTADVGGPFEYIKGIVADVPAAGQHAVSVLQKCDAILSACIGGPLDTTPVKLGRADPAPQQIGDSSASTAIGHYLVRSTASTSVAEPGTLALLGVGLAGLGFGRRRRRTAVPRSAGSRL